MNVKPFETALFINFDIYIVNKFTLSWLDTTVIDLTTDWLIWPLTQLSLLTLIQNDASYMADTVSDLEFIAHVNV